MYRSTLLFFAGYLLGRGEALSASTLRRLNGVVLQPVDQNSETESPALNLRIRASQECDLSEAASFLASSRRSKGHGWNWELRAKLDELVAQRDIESLLRGRFHTIQEGKKSWHHVQRIIDESEQMTINEDEADYGRFDLWWQLRSNRFTELLKNASQETGEDNIWRRHNFALTPTSSSWLNHVQISAVDESSGEVVGFCEVAMLSKPEACRSDEFDFAPAITNLASSPKWRRRGIATRLLRTAERYSRQVWKCDGLALYVEPENTGAVRLYNKCGYEKVVDCEGHGNMSRMAYMSQDSA